MLDITQLDEQAVEVLNEIIKSGNISEIDLGAKLVQFDFSQEELEDITKYLEQQGVTIEEGASVIDSVIMPYAVIKRGAVVRRAIVAENAVIGAGCMVGEETGNIAVVGQSVTLPAGVSVTAGQQVDENTKF